MTNIKKTLRADSIRYLKEGDEIRLITIRTLLDAIERVEKNGLSAPIQINKAKFLSILKSESESRRTAAKAFAEGGRTERADRENAEADFIDTYRPVDLTLAEVEDIVDRAFTEFQTANPDTVLSMKSMGSIMKLANAEIKGRFDGKTVSDLVKSKLV
jgi:uncharacterized protein YqeY